MMFCSYIHPKNHIIWPLPIFNPKKNRVSLMRAIAAKVVIGRGNFFCSHRPILPFDQLMADLALEAPFFITIGAF